MAQQHYQHGGNSPKRHDTPQQAADTEWRNDVQFSSPLNPELFNSIAKVSAQRIAQAEINRNKPTQLRRFYDELLLWESRISQLPEVIQDAKFAEYLPFIRMMNAKAAYAEGRKLVDRNFVELLEHTLKQASSPQTLTICKHFWEAFMGFYKQERQD